MTIQDETKAKMCHQLASEYQARAEQPGVPLRRATALRNISRSYTALAAQFEILAHHVLQEKRILRCGSRAS
jgi:hypothetical protein